MRKITIKNFAKVNPVLEILGRDSETGMHFISTVLMNISRFDVVSVELLDESLNKNDDANRDNKHDFPLRIITCSDASYHLLDAADNDIASLESAERAIPLDMNNTVARAWKLLCEIAGRELPVRIAITKRIPVEAGLGGASGNAAAALVALVKLFNLDIASQELAHIAASIGSDVPFFLSGGLMYGTHYGEKVLDLGECPNLNFIVLKPNHGSNTGQAYKEVSEILGLTAGVERTARTTRGFITALRGGLDVIPHIRNDFDAYALRSTITGRMFAWLQKRLADKVILAGSGSSVVGVFRKDLSRKLIGDAMTDLHDILECVFIEKPVQQGIEVVNWE